MMNKIVMSLLVALCVSTGFASANTLDNKTTYSIGGVIRIYTVPPAEKGLEEIHFGMGGGLGDYDFSVNRIEQGPSNRFAGAVKDITITVYAPRNTQEEPNKKIATIKSSDGGYGAWEVVGPDSDGKFTIIKK